MKRYWYAALGLMACGAAQAATTDVEMHLVTGQGIGQDIGKDGKAVAALAAGGHFDPQKTGKHLGPYADGHLGDLPAIYVTADGMANYPVLAPRLKKISDIEGKALMVHAGGDNHSDHPQPLGGGGERFACGVIK